MTVFSATEAAGEKRAAGGFCTHSEVRAKRTCTWVGCVRNTNLEQAPVSVHIQNSSKAYFPTFR